MRKERGVGFSARQERERINGPAVEIPRRFLARNDARLLDARSRALIAHPANPRRSSEHATPERTNGMVFSLSLSLGGIRTPGISGRVAAVLLLTAEAATVRRTRPVAGDVCVCTSACTCVYRRVKSAKWKTRKRGKRNGDRHGKKEGDTLALIARARVRERGRERDGRGKFRPPGRTTVRGFDLRLRSLKAKDKMEKRISGMGTLTRRNVREVPILLPLTEAKRGGERSTERRKHGDSVVGGRR